METTFAEILEMRRKLNEALEAKIGYEPAAGFSVEMSHFGDNNIEFSHAYTRSITVPCVVNGLSADTPQEAFDNAMAAIKSYEEPPNAQLIESLKNEIKKLQGLGK